MTKHEEIADVLTDEILSERFRPGERLPSERDLAARFDAHRGAVREAMKKVAQMGLADIQPGGARVEPLQNASLDVIGRMLARANDGDLYLAAQVVEVINSLATVAMSHVVARASDEEISSIRRLLQPIVNGSLSADQLAIARLELLHSIMLTSGQLVCQIIARSLIEQLIPQAGTLRDSAMEHVEEHREDVRALDRALAERDREAACSALHRMASSVRNKAFADNQDVNVVEVSI